MPPRPPMPEQVRRCALAVADRLRRDEGLSAREATGRAFAICTSTLQRGGYLKPGTHTPTAKGRARSRAKLQDEEAAFKHARYQRLLKEGRTQRATSRLDRERFARHRAEMRGEGARRGAANKVVRGQGLCENLKPLREAMELVFSCDTAYGTCKSYNPAAAHCFMASSLLQDLYGGEIVSGEIGMVPHYWTKIGGRYVDLTGDQFGRPPIQCSTKSPYPIQATFQRTPHERQEDDAAVQKKYDLFRGRVAQTLRGMGQRAMASTLEG